jgi:hypothetical protein
MIYNIPYNENFVEVLVKQARKENSLVILPGKYLTSIFRAKNVNCISYDDLWFKILPNRASAIVESILINKSIESFNPIIRNGLRKAINEFFYYGLSSNKLICFNSQHDLFKSTIDSFNRLLKESDLFIKYNTLNEVLKNRTSLISYLKKFLKNTVVYAVLPVLFSPAMYEILEVFYKELEINIVIYGLNENYNYEVSYSHAQFFIQKFNNFFGLIVTVYNRRARVVLF